MSRIMIQLTAVAGVLAAGIAQADVRLPAVLGDNMVLQQGVPARIWGWAEPGETVRVKGSWQSDADAVAATTGSDKAWGVALDTPAPGGPYEIQITGNNEITLRSVLVGEVWVCSGQSNMQMPLQKYSWSKGVLNYEKEVQGADLPAIRLFTVKRNMAVTPQTDCEGSWSICTPETVAGFSATAYFFGRELHQALKVPVGLIHASWGGTRAEAWTNRETLQFFKTYDGELAEEIADPSSANVDQHNRGEAERALARYPMEADNRGFAKGYADPGFDDQSWSTARLPAAWETLGTEMQIDGVVWFRKTVTLPEAWAGCTLALSLGPVADCDTTYFNGRKLGSMGYGTPDYWTRPRVYVVPGSFVVQGRNVIAVRVFDDGDDGGLYGAPEQLSMSCGQSVESLATGTWRYHVESVLQENPVRLAHANSPCVLFNAMIAPLTPYRIRGVIWYQGESNHTQGRQYAVLFPALIANWRNVWGQGEFPFYYVQIAPFRYKEPGSAPVLREAQRQTLIVPNTGMVVTTDISDVADIHPRNKQEVGRRLSLWALARTYHQAGVVHSGPLCRAAKVEEGGRIRVSFDHVGGGLAARGGPLTHFEIAGADGRFVAAQADIEGETVVVRSARVETPVTVRFGWTNTAEPNLFNADGLPASPFEARASLPAAGATN